MTVIQIWVKIAHMGEHLTQRVAANVRAELARARVTQITLADHLKLSPASVSRRLSGETPFEIGELVATAGLLGLPLSALVPEADEQVVA